MPGRDGTGPRGMGSLAGRGAGCCSGFAVHKCRHPFSFGHRSGCFRHGHGHRRVFWGFGPHGLAYCGCHAADEAESSAAEKEFLQNKIAFLEERLARAKERLAALLEKEEKKEKEE
ncbi:MAG: DUF5320 domain-containing protein [Firmicutes bacterium]|nr:DUF5320 domain-containing protein [Bacillota bacterium]